MKKFIIIPAIVCALAGVCEDATPPAADYAEGEQSQVLLTPELRAMAIQLMGENADALLHAVRLNMGKYDNDMRTDDGRRRWHGKLIREEIDTNTLWKVQVFSNEVTGAIWRYRMKFKPHRGVNAVPKITTVGTNGVPWRLAAARLRRQQEKQGQTNVVTEVTIGNK